MTQKPYKCRVEYLESTGTQYIDTGYSSNDIYSNGVFEIICSTAAMSNRVVGCGGLNNNNKNINLSFSGGGYILGLYGDKWNSNIFNYIINTKYKIKFGFTTTQQNLYVNDTLVETTNYSWNSSDNYPLRIFKTNADTYTKASKIYSFKLWINYALVRDLIPVLDNSGRPAMYDQVSGQLFYNQGSGEFTYGRQIIPVEYLESTGTQYIDTGLSMPNGFRAVGSYEITQLDSTGGIIGTFTNSAPYKRNFYDYTYGSGNRWLVGYGGDAYQYFGAAIANTKYTFDISNILNNEHLITNGTTYSVSPTGTRGEKTSTNLYLFALNIGNVANNFAKIKAYYMQIYNNDGVLVRDFIPCIDENNTPFMFDLVNCTVYLNAGTGQFKFGPNVEKKGNKKLLRKKLALMLATLKKKRKYYCEVEYLESSGTQWIDTGYAVNTSTDEIETYFQLITTDKYKWLIGEHDNSARFGIGSGDGTNLRNIAYGASTYKVNDTEVYNSQHYFNANSNGVYVNGTQVHAFESFSSTSTVYLFNLNISGGGMGASGKIWRYTQKRNGKVVLDLIPVLDWDMTPCMYDKVTETLFYNQGTGSFTYGREIHYVDYLESTGTQYIDTGIKLTSNHSVEVDYQLTSASQNRKGIFGGLVANGPRFGALLSPSNNYLEFGYGSTNVWYQPGLPDTQRHIMKQQKNLLYFDGVLAYTFSTATFTQDFTSPLGNFNYTNYNPASAKYYSSKWWDNDTLVRDYLPAIDENGVGFMFDRVSHTIFDNAGTGAFKYPARQLEYIRTTGSQYVDTGYMPNQDTKIELVGKFNNTYPSCLWATRWTQSPTYDTYGAYAENNTAGMIYMYYGRYSDGNFISVSNATFPHRDGNFIRFIQDKNKLDFTNLGNSANWTYTFNEATFQSTRSLTLFYFSSSSAFATKGGYIKSCKIWDDDTLVRDFIAAYKDGYFGLYDKVNNALYQNAGSGTFTIGKIVEPEYE